ncbi:hypothetical protein EXIGLDRAFT_716761 [Exidia glandulosa HHB12029]|uniref:F-box domain-containing protein n=1 Tax=Exidia glandulosa HHB12029 TaxID=1314781 RepID=A0A165IRQ1_EXIGL|nr:hypothetical protein EXIGLDRAFT_716761 [Exidia glandulosa HHB12029]
MSRAEQLPVELVLDIFLSAAEISIFEDRPWVVQLALVSHDVYKLVHPVLYRTMVINPQNIDRILLLASDERSLHVFHAVRCLAVPHDEIDFTDDAIASVLARPRLFTSTVDLCAPFYALKEVLYSPDFRPRRIIISHSPLAYVLDRPRAALQSVTHIVGYFPMTFTGPATQWAVDFLSGLPAVTHITFRHLNGVGLNGTRPVDPSILEEPFRTLLESRRIRRLAVHIGGRRLQDLPLLERLEHRLHDPRFCICIDSRPMPRDWEIDCLDVKDILTGKDIWDPPCSITD